MNFLGRILLLIFVIPARLCADPYYLEGINYTANGPIMMQPSPDQEGYALVCGLSDSESYLSLRSGPSTSSPEIIKLNNFMLVHMTGEFSEDNKWSAIDYFLVAADSDGREWREFSQMPIELYGFVSTKYLCDFYDHPEN